MRKRTERGTSLVEVLVVIVILAIGIFALIRLFPSGFISLERSKEQAQATQLARQYLERMKGTPENIPVGIYPVVYKISTGNNLLLEVDSTVRPDDLGIWNPPDDVKGALAPGWEHYFRDANRIRRVIGETTRVPAPKPVGSNPNDPNMFGGLYQVKFAPILYDDRVFQVYSGELSRRSVSRQNAGDPVCLPTRNAEQSYYLDPNIGAIWLPVSQFEDVTYKIDLSVWVLRGSQLERHDYVGLQLTTDPNMLVSDPDCWPPPPALNAISGFDLKPFVLATGETFNSIDLDTVHVYRSFERIDINTAWDPKDPYEYKVLEPNIGMVLFNPAGYNYQERRQRQLIPLRANFDYDVYDWHIIQDERRVGSSAPYNIKLTLDEIKLKGELNNDNTRYQGLALPGGPNADTDLLIVDVADGSTVVNEPNKRSYTIDGLKGIVKFEDTVWVRRPDDLTKAFQISPADKTFRFLYMSHNDWAVQIQKATHRYQLLPRPSGATLGVGQCWVSHEGLLVSGQHAASPRMYFPLCDIGKTVVIREYYWVSEGYVIHVARDEEFVILAPRADDIVQLGYISITDHHNDALGFEVHDNIVAAQGVMGTSVKARVIWAPTQRERSAEERQLVNPQIRFIPSWRMVDFDTHLTKEVAD